MRDILFPLLAFRSVCRRLLLPTVVLLLLAAPEPVRAAGDAHLHEDFGWTTLPMHVFFEHHGAPMLLVDPETGTILHGNKAAREFYGYPDLCGRNIGQINILSPEEIRQEMERARSLKKNHCHLPHRLADGTVRDVEFYSYAAPVEGRDLLYSVVVDRTDEAVARSAVDARNRWIVGLLLAAVLAQSAVLLLLARAVKRRRSAERASERQFAFVRSLIDVIPNPVFYKDREGRYLGCNEAFKKATGRTDDEIAGKTVYDMGPEELADEYKRRDDELFADPKPQRYEWQVQSAAGERKDVLFNKAPFFDEKGALAGLVGVLTDITERKQAEEALRRSEARLQAIVVHSPLLISEFDAEGRYLLVNPTVAAFFGLSREELVGKTFGELLPPEICALFMERIVRVRATLQPVLVEDTIQTGGETRHFITTLFPLLHDDGKLRSIGSIAHDITDRREDEERLRASEEKYRLLVENLNEGVWRIDGEGRTVYVNQRMGDILGYRVEEMIGRHLFDFMDERGRRIAEENLERRKSGIREMHDAEMMHRSGRRVFVHLATSPILDENGEYNGAIAGVIDITDRKLAEEELRTTRDSLDKLIRYANAPIVVWDQDFRIIRFNRAFERMTEYSSEEVIGRRLDILFPEESREMSLDRIRGTLAGEFWEMVEVPIRRKNGEIRFALWNSANVFADDGVSLIAVIAQGMDITDRKRAEDQLRQTLANARVLRKEAEAANRAKSAFLANMSHEIRTPLNGVIGFLALLAGTRLDEEQQEFVGNIDTSARLLLEVISNVLDLSKIEAEQLDLKPVPSDLRGTAKRSLAPVRLAAAGKGVVLSATVEKNVPETVVFDPVRLEQVLVNLLSNAVKFTERGSVEFSVRFAPLSESTGAFTFSVRDTGIGISPEERERIFEPFYQADSSSTREYGGTGLGLSICERLLRKMGSSLKVESVPGEGSRFFFTLRLEYGGRTGEARSDGSAAASSERGARIPPGRMKENAVVLIVEDEKMSMKMIALLISKLAPSASVLRASDGGQAVALFRERRPDLIFMDLHMPEKDGFEATAEIRAFEAEADPERERCRIVALTADALSETRGECIAAGMDDYLSKPVHMEEIRAVLERCLGTDARGGRAPD